MRGLASFTPEAGVLATLAIVVLFQP